MKSDINGCSTCPAGEERYEPFRSVIGTDLIQYDYRHTDGSLFSCVVSTLAVFNEDTNDWYLIGSHDLNWRYGFTLVELLALGESEAKSRYLESRR